MIKLENGTVAYTTREAAERAGVIDKSIVYQINTKKLAARKIGNKWYITEQALDDYIARRTSKA